MAQFDIYKSGGFAGYLLDIQHDFLSDLRTRLVVPLVPDRATEENFPRLNPVLAVDEKEYVLAPHLMATVDTNELTTSAGTLIHERDRIVAALDFLFFGY